MADEGAAVPWRRDMRYLSVTIFDDLDRRLRAMAKSQGRRLADVVSEAIERLLDEEEGGA
jgi:predicted DNA-binding protein